MKESSHKSNVLVFLLLTLIWFRVRGRAASAGRPIHTGDVISPECPRSAPGSPPGWTGAPYPSLIDANAKSRVIRQGLTRSFSHTCIIMFLLFLNFPLPSALFVFCTISHPKLHLFTSLLLPLLTILTLTASCQSARHGGFSFPLPTSTTRSNQMQLCRGFQWRPRDFGRLQRETLAEKREHYSLIISQ